MWQQFPCQAIATFNHNNYYNAIYGHFLHTRLNGLNTLQGTD